nr:hypothetical protein [Pseudomonadota bacterium]
VARPRGAVRGGDGAAEDLGRELCGAIAGGAYGRGRSRGQLRAWLRPDVGARLRTTDRAFLGRNERRDK